MAIKPIHLAVLMPDCAEARDGGIAVSSRLGPQIEMMAELVGKTTILGYDAPEVGRKIEDRTDFVMRPAGGRIELISLGPRGTFRDYLSRRRRVRDIVLRESPSWDALSTPLINRRVGLVYGPSKCRRIMAQSGGHNGEAIRSSGQPFHKIALPLLASAISERTYRKMARDSLFFVNGEALLPYYNRGRAHAEVVRTSARRAEFTYAAPDRLNTSAPKFVVLSRLTALKGVDDAITAFAELKRTDLPGATLDIIGTGDAEEQLRRQATDLGVADSITWHGWVALGPDLFHLLQQMDVMLTLSHSESLPNTVWECMAQSLLIVTTPVGALPHVFRDGEDVLFVPEFDPGAATAAVRKLAGDADLRQRLLTRGLETSAQVTVEAVATELLDRMAARWPELRADG